MAVSLQMVMLLQCQEHRIGMMTVLVYNVLNLTVRPDHTFQEESAVLFAQVGNFEHMCILTFIFPIT